jgi:flagellar biosynthesis chaperone FliJ
VENYALHAALQNSQQALDAINGAETRSLGQAEAVNELKATVAKLEGALGSLAACRDEEIKAATNALDQIQVTVESKDVQIQGIKSQFAEQMVLVKRLSYQIEQERTNAEKYLVALNTQNEGAKQEREAWEKQVEEERQAAGKRLEAMERLLHAREHSQNVRFRVPLLDFLMTVGRASLMPRTSIWVKLINLEAMEDQV